MIFEEIYSAYYNAVAQIISAIISGNTDEKNLIEIVYRSAFSESVLSVLPALKNQQWQLITSDMKTKIRHIPTMPLTIVEKQWLKAVLSDPRVKLFDIRISGLDDTEPLYTPEDYVIYDKYSDGDPYGDEKYIEHFRTILKAMRLKKNLRIEMPKRNGGTLYARIVPERLEYSEKDDKFRLITSGCEFTMTVNIAKITKCRIYEGENVIKSNYVQPVYEELVLKVYDDRNALERCMLHFAHFEKRVERIDEKLYLLHIKYDRSDESEIVIRVLSFGPFVEVTESQHLRNLIIDKLKKQKNATLDVKGL